MSDEFPPKTAETADTEALPQGVTRLVEAALHAPPPPAGAETASQERALSAYQESLLAPRPLHPESWRPPDGTSLTARLAHFLRRLRGE